jgi:predicted NBD/HSP70 family sugar kinase
MHLPNMYVVCDIGGTKTRVAGTTTLDLLDRIQKFDTPKLYEDGLNKIVEAIKTVADNKQIIACVAGIRGPLNHEKTGIVSEVTLHDWVGRNIVKDLADRLDTQVFLENDTALVGLGEIVFGAGKGYRIAAYHTVSTGVGGARFVNGLIDVSSTGFEPGHQILDVDHTLMHKGIAPTLENLISGTALEKKRGVKPYEIPQSDHVWEELARYLGYGLRNTIVYWSPEIIVLGGSMIIGNPRIPLEAIIRYTQHALAGLVPCPRIVDATLRDEGGLFGGMALLRQRQSN